MTTTRIIVLATGLTLAGAAVLLHADAAARHNPTINKLLVFIR